MTDYDYSYSLQSFIRAVDGDTFDMTVAKEYDFGFHLTEVKRYTGRFRLVIADTPERGEPNYKEATYFVNQWVINHGVHALRVDTYTDPDNFGRYLADVVAPDGETLSGALLKAGLAQPYNRGK